ncbi:MAG TPA: TauD/TfdA family dioxygenase [Hyphomicrobiales bacterium]|nr:TauD/TfdA family dioxygenase [Hyphomicrobiales bacterium]
MKTAPLKQDYGIEISGVDVRSAAPATLAEIVRLLNAHGAIVVREQALAPADLVAFTRLFGTPAYNPRHEHTVPGYPDIFVISNKIVDGRPIGDLDAGSGWHFDMPYERLPGYCTLLYALEVPPEGSDTLLADLCAAWDELPAERQEDLADLVVHHSYAQLASLKGTTLTAEHRRRLPDVFHPLVRRHPHDGRLALRPCLGGSKGILGVANPQGLDLLKELVAFVTQERFVYAHKWRVGDLLVWDNNCTLHRGTPFDRDRYIRHVQRTWIQSPEEHYRDRPVLMPAPERVPEPA